MYTRLPTEPRERDLAKMDMLAELYVRSISAKGLMSYGPIRISPELAMGRFREELLRDKNYWLAVFEKAKVIVNL